MEVHHAQTRVTLIGIAGPSCAVKSTVTEHHRNRVSFSLVPRDHFFRKTPAGFAHGVANREIAEALMLDRLATCLAELKRGKPVLISRGPRIRDFSPLVEGFLLFVWMRSAFSLIAACFSLSRGGAAAKAMYA